jgi:FkbM family methyltransferase
MSTGSAVSAVTDRYKRQAYFDEADDYTPYLATRAGDALFLVKTEDKHIARSLFAKRGRGELAVLDRAAAAIKGLRGEEAVVGRTFIDVGANIGTTTVPALLSHGFGTAIAIEPEPENFRVLRLNLVLNGVEDRVTALAVAASNEVGTQELVVTRDRSGKHWIATDRSKLSKKDAAKATILTVETTTLDRLVDSGTIDPETVGLLWMDAEAHEGHILAGSSTLIERGVPLVLEWNPVILDRVGDRGRLEREVAENYTHFASMSRDPDPEGASYPLQAIARLPAYAERFLDPKDPATKADILVLRLEGEEATGISSLDDFVRPIPDEDDSELPTAAGAGVFARIRARLRRRG